MSARTMARYWPGVTGGIVAFRVEVYDWPGSSVPVKDTLPNSGLLTLQVASGERKTASDQVPVAGWLLTLVTVQRIVTGSPVTAADGTVTAVTCRSLAGGNSMIIGTLLGALLLFWLGPSKTVGPWLPSGGS